MRCKLGNTYIVVFLRSLLQVVGVCDSGVDTSVCRNSLLFRYASFGLFQLRRSMCILLSFLTWRFTVLPILFLRLTYLSQSCYFYDSAYATAHSGRQAPFTDIRNLDVLPPARAPTLDDQTHRKIVQVP